MGDKHQLPEAQGLGPFSDAKNVDAQLQVYDGKKDHGDTQEPPPTYEPEGRAISSQAAAATLHLYRPFPSVLNAYAEWFRLRSFLLCGESKTDRLYCAELHSGYSGQGVLGSDPGILLHSGPSVKDPVVAAGRKEQPKSQFNFDCIIMLPPSMGPNPTATGGSSNRHDRGVGLVLTREKMQARVRGDKVAFGFSIEVGHDRQKRGRFEWRKLDKNEASAEDTSDGAGGGFKLFRHSSPAADADAAPEPLALVTWGFSKNYLTRTHMFELRLLGTAPKLGERWTLMVVMTALMVYYVRMQGGTKKGAVNFGEKVHGKGKAVAS